MAGSTTAEVEPGAPTGPPPHRARGDPARVSTIDVAIALVLAAAAVVPRWIRPVDGWFYDDAWQVMAARGPVDDLPTLGQTQPLYTLGLMGWSRVVGSGDVAMMLPALVAGALGPALLYLVLRHLRFGRPVAAVLAAVLVGTDIHVRYSARVKVYTAELLVVLALVVVLPRLASRRWGPRTATAWVVAAVATAAFSSFSLIAVSCAGLVLVLHPSGDRLLRALAVAVQGAATAVLVAWTQSTYDAESVASVWRTNGAMIDRSPVTGIPAEVVRHLHEVVRTYPGPGPTWMTGAVLVGAAAGLAGACWRGPRTVVARFLVLATAVAAVGSLAGKVPFGPPPGDARRATLWLVPVVAFGLAACVDTVGRALRSAARSPAAPRVRSGPVGWAFDGVLVAAAVAVLVAGVRRDETYWKGGRTATRAAVAELGPNDLLLVTRLTVPSFAIYADLPYRMSPSGGLVGFEPHFDDPRVVPLRSPSGGEGLDRVGETDRVVVLNSPTGRRNRRLLFELGIGLRLAGFEQRASRSYLTTQVLVWERSRPAEPRSLAN